MWSIQREKADRVLNKLPHTPLSSFSSLLLSVFGRGGDMEVAVLLRLFVSSLKDETLLGVRSVVSVASFSSSLRQGEEEKDETTTSMR